jgi:hypothetical protein
LYLGEQKNLKAVEKPLLEVVRAQRFNGICGIILAEQHSTQQHINWWLISPWIGIW